MRHPSIRGRHIVVVGPASEAQAWAQKNDINVEQVMVADTARRMVGLQPETVHLVLTDGFADWRNPHHFMLKTEVAYMQAKGATLEWA